jgi:fructose-bisphosphate aldolase class II
VDALAISFGTAHGVYTATPKLDIGLLKEINAVSPVPLVMHGGSGTPDDQVREAIRNGITKFNVYADSRVAINSGFAKACEVINNRPDELPELVFKPLYRALMEQVRAKIRLAGAGANTDEIFGIWRDVSGTEDADT